MNFVHARFSDSRGTPKDPMARAAELMGLARESPLVDAKVLTQSERDALEMTPHYTAREWKSPSESIVKIIPTAT